MLNASFGLIYHSGGKRIIAVNASPGNYDEEEQYSPPKATIYLSRFERSLVQKYLATLSSTQFDEPLVKAALDIGERMFAARK